MLYGCTTWPWVFKKAFVGTAADLSTAKLFHPCPGAVAWHVTNPAAGTISVVGADSFFVPAMGFLGHCFVVGVHASARCIIPFWVVPDHAPLTGPNWPVSNPTFKIYPELMRIRGNQQASFIRPRLGAYGFNAAFHQLIKLSAGDTGLSPLSDYFGYLTWQDDYANTATYKTRTDYPFSTEVTRTSTTSGGDATVPSLLTVNAAVSGTRASYFHLLMDAQPFGAPAGSWVMLDAASGEYGTSVLSAGPLAASFQASIPGTYGVLVTDDWDCFYFDFAHTPTLHPL